MKDAETFIFLTKSWISISLEQGQSPELRTSALGTLVRVTPVPLIIYFNPEFLYKHILPHL